MKILVDFPMEEVGKQDTCRRRELPKRINWDNRAGNIARDAAEPEIEARSRKDHFFV